MFSQATINALEKGRSSGKDIVKRLEVLFHYPAVALEFFLFNRGYINDEKWDIATKWLLEKGKARDE